MSYFRKKPVVIEAWRNTEDPPDRGAVPKWLSDAIKAGTASFPNRYHGPLVIKTLEGDMKMFMAAEQWMHKADDAEHCFAQAYYIVTGESPRWSPTFGHQDALNDIKETMDVWRAIGRKAEPS